MNGSVLIKWILSIVITVAICAPIITFIDPPKMSFMAKSWREFISIGCVVVWFCVSGLIFRK